MGRTAFILAGIVLAAAATSASPREPAVQAGALTLYSELERITPADKNLFYSPPSVEQAFGLVHAGSAGATRSQIEQFFAFPAGEAADRLLAERREHLLGSKFVNIRLANGMWLANSFAVRPTYLADTATYYAAGVERLDFGGDAAGSAARINAWVAEKTSNLIDHVVDEQSTGRGTKAILANALYFEADWNQSFSADDTRKQNFLFGDGRERPFELMQQLRDFATVERRGWRAVRMPYRGEQFAMDVIMPAQREAKIPRLSFTEIAAIDAALRKAPLQSTELQIPRFEVEYNHDLTLLLQKLGLALPFDGERADLSAMAESGPERLSVSGVQQATKLQVFEQGTKAAAVTTTGIVVTGARKLPKPKVRFVVDHPFAVVIRDLSNGEILFIGRIAKPEAYAAP